MSKSITLILFLIFSGINIWASGNMARIDIKGVPITFKKQDGVSIGYGTWQAPQNVKKYITTKYPASREWKTGKLTFTPHQDGIVRIMLLGPFVKGGKVTKLQALGVYYDNIKVNGVLIKNGDFESGKKNWYWGCKEKNFPARLISNPSIAKLGNNCALGWHDGSPISKFKVKKNETVTLTFDYKYAGKVPPASETNQFYPLSLLKTANMGFEDKVAGDKKGGWTDQGPKNDLRLFPSGTKSYKSWPFTIIDPASNHGRSCVVFKSKNSPFGIESITLPVNKTCNSIALLNTAAWAKKGTIATTVKVNYANGKKETFPLVVGKQTGEWWNPKALSGADIVWSAGSRNGEIGVYLTVLKLKRTAKIKSVTINTGKDGVVWGLLGATAGLVLKSADDLNSISCEVKIDPKAKLVALPLNVLSLEMNEKNLPAELFFDRNKNLNKIIAVNQDGKKLDHQIAMFSRNMAPVILVKTDGKTNRIILKTGTSATSKYYSPREAFRKITGKDGSQYKADDWINGRLLYPKNVILKQTSPVADEDSFYNNAVAMNQNQPEWKYSFQLKEPKAYKLYVYSRSPKNFSNQFYVKIDNRELIKLGGYNNQPSCYYWGGGERVFLKPGKHNITLIAKGNIKRREDLSLAKLYLAEDLLTPIQPGISDELAALVKEGFYVHGFSSKSVKKTAKSKDDFHRIVNAKKSYPDLSGLVDSKIEQRGTLHAKGKEFQFKDGTKLSQIWGCNMGSAELMMLAQKNRLGKDGLDVFMQHIKSMGYSTIRYMINTLPRKWGMNQNNFWPPLLSQNPLRFSVNFLPNLQKLVAACHRNGLYLSITLWHDNCFFTDLGATRKNHAYIGFFHPEAIRRQKEIVKMFMTTPNPYRNNIIPAKDPTVLIYEIENERTFVATYMMKDPSNWKKLPEATRDILYKLWSKFLQKKYSTIFNLKKTWNISSMSTYLRPKRKSEIFENIEFPATWNIEKWGNDKSNFKVKMDDLRISKAAFGKNKRSNPYVSDGLEFMYEIYSKYLKEMYDYARSLGFGGIITANGPDCELFYSQRAGVNNVVDAVSGGTGYWNRRGYGFLRSLDWLAPMVYFATPDKPIISREYGANLVYKNSWWGNLIAATMQKSMGKAYLFNFKLNIPDLKLADWFYPDDSFEKRSGVNLKQHGHLYSHFANLAAAIAVRSPELKRPEFKLEIAYPIDNVCYAAQFRGYNKMTMNNFVPFLYTDSSVRTFKKKYKGKADLVINEPSTPAGDYSFAKNTFFIKPHSALSRYGQDASSWFKNKTFSASGFIDTDQEQKALYDSINSAGGKLPVSFDEYGKIWRNSNRTIEINTLKAYYLADTSTFASFIGNLDNAKGKMPRCFKLTGTGDAWSFYGQVNKKSDVFFAIMNGQIDLKNMSSLNYIFIGGKNIEINNNGKKFLLLKAGETVNIGLKSESNSLLNTPKIYVTFFRNKSIETPAKLTFARKIKAVYACNRSGEKIASIPFSKNSFRNFWEQGSKISYYEVIFK